MKKLKEHLHQNSKLKEMSMSCGGMIEAGDISGGTLGCMHHTVSAYMVAIQGEAFVT